jgi:hypothetical protein
LFTITSTIYYKDPLGTSLRRAGRTAFIPGNPPDADDLNGVDTPFFLLGAK